MTKPRDQLLERYADAVAQDPRRPSDRVRNAVRAHAQMLRDQAAAVQRVEAAASTPRPAANLPQWTLSMVASLVVIGLAGLLYVQVDRGAHEDREMALGVPAPAPATADPARIQEPAAAQTAKPQPTAPANAADNAALKATQPGKRAQPPNESAEAVADATSTKSDPDLPVPVPVPVPVPSPAPAAKAMTPPPLSAMRSAGRLTNTTAANQEFLAAVQTGQTDTVQQLLAQGMPVNARFDNGNTALMLAVIHRQEVLVKLLLSQGADTSLVNQQGMTAVQIANQMGFADIAKRIRPD